MDQRRSHEFNFIGCSIIALASLYFENFKIIDRTRSDAVPPPLLNSDK